MPCTNNTSRKLCLVLWKNILLRKKAITMTVFELLFPFIFFALHCGINAFISPIQPIVHDSTSSTVIDIDTEVSKFEYCYNNVTPFYNKLMQDVFKETKIFPYTDETELNAACNKQLRSILDYLNETTNEKNHKEKAAIIFKHESTSEKPTNLKYTIRIPFGIDKSFNTEKLFPETIDRGPLHKHELYQDFVAIQENIDRYFINSILVSQKHSPYKITKISFPYPSYSGIKTDESIDNIHSHRCSLCTFFVGFGYISSFLILMKLIMAEKISGIKELMKLMGIQSWIIWIGWVINCLVLCVISLTILVILMKYVEVKYLLKEVFESFDDKQTSNGMIEPTKSKSGFVSVCDFFIFWFFLLLYIVATMCLTLFMCTLFNRSIRTLLLRFMLTFIIYITVRQETLSSGVKTLFLIISPMASLYYGFETIISFEFLTGLTWSNFNNKQPEIFKKIYPMSHIFLALFFQIIIYSILTWYFDNVKPGYFGLAKSWHFPFTSLCRKFCCKPVVSDDYDLDNKNQVTTLEEPPEKLEIGIQIRNLRKNFGSTAAIDGLSMDIYKEEITALLGQNGAGKTTLISILTGMFGSTKGDVFINNYNIKTQLNQVRHNFGLCTQHDMLFSYLTLEDHLRFFSMLKGKSCKEAKEETEFWLRTLNLLPDRYKLVKKLSGGMKRKLSLAIALIGDPKFVLLDEPSSGLDPEARRTIWNVVLGLRAKKKVILITTHSMEEADVLGDRIAIMDHGKLVCYGTSMFLKHTYGTGYQLDLLKSDENMEIETVANIIKEYVPSVRLKSNIGGVVSFSLPNEASSEFPELFMALEELKLELNIRGIGLSITTLEEVFLRVGEIAKEQRIKVSQKDSIEIDEDSNEKKVISKKHGIGLELYRLIALMRKKLVYMRKTFVNIIIFCLIPILVTSLSYLLLKDNYNVSPLPIDLKAYGQTYVYFHSNPNSETLRDLSQIYASLLPTNNIGIPVEDVTEELIREGKEDLNNFRRKIIVSAVFSESSKGIEISGMHSTVALHALPISVNLISNTLLKYYGGKNYSITTINYPYEGSEDKIRKLIMKIVNFLLVWIFLIPLGFVMMVGGFINYPVNERMSKCKHLQLMTGVRPFTYWFSTYILDFCIYLIVTLIIIMIVGIVDVKFRDLLPYLFTLLMFHGLSGILYTYVITLLFKKTNSAYIMILVKYMLLMIIGLIVYMVLFAKKHSKKKVKYDTLAALLDYFGTLITPHFALLRGSLQLRIHTLCSKIGCQKLDNIDIACCTTPARRLQHVLIMSGLDIIIYFSILMLYEYSYKFKKSKKSIKNQSYTYEIRRNSDVVKEKIHVTNYLSSEYSGTPENFLAFEIEKWFGRFKAVDDISFSVNYGECFGLLGVNGAGKTTTFRILTGDLRPTSGDAFIDNYSLSKNRRLFLSQIGYCPQFDGLIECLSGRDMLKLFARLRGVCSKDVNDEVNKWLNLLGLTEFANRNCGRYSGGNKRKLSAGIALIGDPPIILMDEPTTGVDPISRRNFWNVMSKLDQQSVVLTTHSMEDCEASCNRIAIMVNGQFKCLGTLQHLKQRFGQGFTLQMKIRFDPEKDEVTNAQNLLNLKAKIKVAFECELKDEHEGFLHYHLTNPQTSWFHIFQTIEELKLSTTLIEDYTVSDTTLEQIFLSFAQGKY